MKSLKEAESRFEEAEKSLSFARKNLLVAESKAGEIRAQAVIVANQTAKNLLDTVDEDIKRLKSVNFSFIQFEEEKMIAEVVLQCFNLSILFYLSYDMDLSIYLFSVLFLVIINQFNLFGFFKICLVRNVLFYISVLLIML